MAAALTSFGQGLITYGNNPTGFRAPIYGADPANPALSVSGQTATGTPAGTTTYNGPLLNGSGYTLGFLGGASAGSMTLLTTQPFRSSSTGALPAGLVLGGTLTLNQFAAGSTLFYQYVAWDNKGGTITDWAAAQTAWNAGTIDAGMSSVQSAVLGGTGPSGPIATPNAAGWTSFNIYAVPEPGTVALLGLGAAAMLIFRR